MNRVLLALLAMPLVSFSAIAAAPGPKAVPAFVSLPPTLHPANDQSTSYEDYGEAEFDTHASDQPLLLKGHYWHVNMVLNMPTHTDDTAVLWAAIKPALLKGGWTIADEYTTSGVVRYKKNGLEARAEFSFPSADQIQMDLVEIAPPAIVLTLTRPGMTPEKLSTARRDFPYLAALPGSNGGEGVQDNMPMTVRLPGSDEDELVGSGSIKKSYLSPPGLSTLAFATAYNNALAKAGWTIVAVSQGPHQADASVLAHYTKDGRDIWADLHDEAGDYSIQVADAGADADLAKLLAKECHVALHGVLFDFNKSTLKPESDSILQQVEVVLQKTPALKLEVQGHTDNVGDDAYNQTLSEARAKSVMAWLTAHGAAPNRLSFKGFGKTMPVASNDTDDGRAKNRRVEIADTSCKRH